MQVQDMLFLLLTHIHYKQTDAFEKLIQLNTTELGRSGINLTLVPNHVTIINNAWHINPVTQDDTDLKIDLNNEWGFHSSVESTIHLVIDGFTPNVTIQEGKVLILFAVDNRQYFSMFIPLENGQAWKSYPSFKNKPLAVSNDVVSDIITLSDSMRYHRISNSTYVKDNWVQIGSGIWYKTALEWPLNIQITNDPINDETHYKCFLPNKILSVTYTTSFVTNKGMDIYIMNDASDGKPFDIYSIDVSYTYFTESPTLQTLLPTIAPIKSSNTNTPIIAIKPTRSPQTTLSNTSEHMPVINFNITMHIIDVTIQKWLSLELIIVFASIVCIIIGLCLLLCVYVAKKYYKLQPVKNKQSADTFQDANVQINILRCIDVHKIYNRKSSSRVQHTESDDSLEEMYQNDHITTTMCEEMVMKEDV
eukprot:304591_1